MAEQVIWPGIATIEGRGFSFDIRISTNVESWRTDTIFTKEPETIAWIDAMQPGSVLFDIGANIGIYTLYAASRGITVVAVEPVLENYTRLVENTELNGFKNVIPIYGACGSNEKDPHWFADLAIPDATIGASGAQLGGNQFVTWKVRRVPCYEMEYLVYALDLAPTHIKIDVDGQERAVLEGVVMDDAESILVEINPEQWAVDTAIQEMRDTGFIPDPLFNEMKPHSSERREREGIKAVNMVFKREEV